MKHSVQRGIPSVNQLYSMNLRYAFRRQTSQHQRRASPQILCIYLGARQPAAPYNRCPVADRNIRAHPDQLRRMSKSAFKDIFNDHRRTLRSTRHRQKLRLQIKYTDPFFSELSLKRPPFL